MSLPEVTEMQAERVQEGILLKPVRSEPLLPKEECRTKFTALAEQWIAERGPFSLVRDVTNHPAYQEVIAMGKDVIPFILERLATQVENWFPALTAITGIDPVPPENAGKLKEMAKVWQQWGEKMDTTSNRTKTLLLNDEIIKLNEIPTSHRKELFDDISIYKEL